MESNLGRTRTGPLEYEASAQTIAAGREGGIGGEGGER